MIKRLIALVLGVPLLWQIGNAITDPLGWGDREDVVRQSSVAPAPMTIRVMYTYAGNVSAPVTRITVKPGVRLRPGAIVLSGCGGGILSNYAPAEAVVISVHDDPALLDRQSLLSACVARDPTAIEAALKEQLNFALANVDQLALVDPKRLVLIGAGDAGPIVARVEAPVRAKLLFGDPCFIAWPAAQVDEKTPTTIFRGDTSRARARAYTKPLPRSSSDPAVMIQAIKDPRPTIASMYRPCVAQPRKKMPDNFVVVTSPRPISSFGPPTEEEKAAHAAFRAAVGKTFWRTTSWR